MSRKLDLSRSNVDAAAVGSIRMTITVSEIVARYVSLTRRGYEYVGLCPFHEERTPSFTVHDGKGFFHCFGCSTHGDAIAFVMKMHQVRFPEAVRMLTGSHQLPETTAVIKKPALDMNDTIKTTNALQLWARREPVGEILRNWFRSRSLGDFTVPDTLGFIASCQHRHLEGKRAIVSRHPAMLALVTRGDDNAPIALHRTYLAQNGWGKAPVASGTERKLLGPARGGAVRLAEGITNPLVIGEGIETTAAVMAATGLTGWAALTTSGMRGLILPTEVRDLVIAADGDAPGEAAAKAAAHRWRAEGRRVRIARPPRGSDFNDMLVEDGQ